MGRLFPVLDANVILIPAGENASQLALAGAYRPPFAAVGQGLDRVLLHRAASATVRSLLRRMAETIGPPARPERAAGRQPRRGREQDVYARSWPVTERGSTGGHSPVSVAAPAAVASGDRLPRPHRLDAGSGILLRS